MVIKQSDQAQREQDDGLESEAGAAAARLRDSIAETRATVLITSHNPAFRDFYLARGDRYAKIATGGRTMDRVNGALLYLSGLYPDSIVQASFIDGGGAKNAGVVRGSREAPHVLAEDVSRDAFFRPALALNLGPRAPVASAHLAHPQASGSCPIPRRCRVALVPRSSTSSSGSSGFGARSAFRTAASRSPYSTHVPAQSCWTAAPRSRQAPSSGFPATRDSVSSPARPRTALAISGAFVLSTGRSPPPRAPRTTGSSLPRPERISATSLIGFNSLPIALALLGVVLIGAAMARRWVRTSKDALTDALTPRQPPEAGRRPRPRAAARESRAAARRPDLRSRRLQALQRRLRSSGRRRTARAARTPARPGNR